jgi:hypothetical protein
MARVRPGTMVSTVIRQWVDLFGILLTLIGVVIAFFQLKKVHTLVNSQLQTVMKRVNQLTKALDDAGIDVPVIKGVDEE